MNQLRDHGIVLTRTDYGEADRIITFITAQHGKVRAIAKGVRKQKSKLAGGVELFSVSELQYIKGKGDIDTLTSTRLQKHFGTIVSNLERTVAGYDFLKKLMRATEDEAEEGYFDLLRDSLAALDDPTIELDLVRSWFYAQLLQLAGHQPDLSTDVDNKPLAAGSSYIFDFESGRFRAASGDYGVSTDAIKLLRLLCSHSPDKIAKVQGIAGSITPAVQLLKQMSEYYILPAARQN